MWFALIGIVLLLALGGLLMKDYDRKWKDYQRQFAAIEVEKTRVKLDAANIELDANTEYTDLVEKIKKVKAGYMTKCGDLNQVNTQISKLKTESEIIDQNYRASKTNFDVAKFNYEDAIGHHKKGSKTLKQTYLTLEKETNSLKIAQENSNTQLDAKEKVIADCALELKGLEKKKRKLTSQLDLIQKKLEKTDPSAMSFANQIAHMIRDLPILDLSTPNEKIEQVVLKDITNNLIFAQVPKVERCITCHLGTTNPDFENEPQPFRTHPNLELFLSNDSPHPVEEFGCTVCHGGRERGTSFNSTAHTPANHTQEEEWKEKYGWEEMHHWENPMLPSTYFESGCFKCHTGKGSIMAPSAL